MGLQVSSSICARSTRFQPYATSCLSRGHLRQAEKEEKAADAEDGAKKKKGGVQVPEDWPWEEAKKLFEKPDVVPASEVEV